MEEADVEAAWVPGVGLDAAGETEVDFVGDTDDGVEEAGLKVMFWVEGWFGVWCMVGDCEGVDVAGAGI